MPANNYQDHLSRRLSTFHPFFLPPRSSSPLSLNLRPRFRFLFPFFQCLSAGNCAPNAFEEAMNEQGMK